MPRKTTDKSDKICHLATDSTIITQPFGNSCLPFPVILEPCPPLQLFGNQFHLVTLPLPAHPTLHFISFHLVGLVQKAVAVPKRMVLLVLLTGAGVDSRIGCLWAVSPSCFDCSPLSLKYFEHKLPIYTHWLIDGLIVLIDYIRYKIDMKVKMKMMRLKNK